MTTKTKQDKSPYCGEYDRPVEADGRIRLPADVVHQLEAHGVGRLWVSKIPGTTGLILCPEDSWPNWSTSIKQALPILKTPTGMRTFGASSKKIRWDRKNRISIPSRLLLYADIQEGRSVVIVGLEDHFEVWVREKFDEMAEQCMEEVARSLQKNTVQ